MPQDIKQAPTTPPSITATAARKPARGAGPLIMVAGLLLAVCAVLFVPLLSGGAATASSTSVPVSSVVEVQAYSSLSAAVEALGFSPALPAEAGSPVRVGVLNGTTLEAVYTVDGVNVTYRTAQGAEDLSGDYTEYAYTLISDVDGVARSYAGPSADKLTLAVWASEGYAFSLVADGSLEAGTLMALAESVAQ